MKPYRVNIEHLGISEEITDERELMKLKLVGHFLKVTAKLTNEDILAKTGLDKSDLSRLKASLIDRFTIDRLIGILSSLGYVASVSLRPRKVG